MPLTRDVVRRAILVAHAHGAGFVDLVELAELDRTTAFRGASMRRTDLRGQNFTGFDFTEADFEAADVRGADFSGATGLTAEMFHNTRSDHTTIWPQSMKAKTRVERKTRLKIDLSQEAVDQMESLMEKTGAVTKIEVIRNAITLMGWATEEVKKGNTIASFDVNNNKLTELRMPVLEAAARDLPQEKYSAHSYDHIGQQAATTIATTSEREDTFRQVWQHIEATIDLTELSRELVILRNAMREDATEPEQDISIAAIAMAQTAAKAGDGPTTIGRLWSAGKWAYDKAVAIGATVAVSALKSAL